MRESEFWNALEWTFGSARGRSLAADLVLSTLGGKSPYEALEAGSAPHDVWLAICEAMDLPAEYRYIHRVKPEDRQEMKAGNI